MTRVWVREASTQDKGEEGGCLMMGNDAKIFTGKIFGMDFRQTFQRDRGIRFGFYFQCHNPVVE
jgi:hypothetical protein